MVDRAFAWLAEYSYAFVVVAAAIDATALPFPGRLVLIAAGVLAATGRADLMGTVAAGLAGAVAGDHLWYFGGQLARGRLEALYRWLARRRGHRATDAADFLRRYGGLAIVIGRFVAVVRVFVWPVASAHGIGYGRFIAWDVAAATLWAGAFVGGGYFLAGRPLHSWSASVGRQSSWRRWGLPRWSASCSCCADGVGARYPAAVAATRLRLAGGGDIHALPRRF